MIIRPAEIDDVKQIQIVRNSVTENALADPNLVTDEDCINFITVKGKGWVCEMDNQIVGFAIVDLLNHNIWALFINPNFEGKGIGQLLHNEMLDWYFEQTQKTVWLGTAFNTRAEHFYTKAGWKIVGKHGLDETKFEMKHETWQRLRINR
ncbi:MAG: GNAT family N-acetyltransferase [Flavobacteriales bacterium]|nr:MAG: GNAT family N-acetyltransferase [Flavobacteriales bacterium]